jgi:hypothetical protein
MDTAVLVAIITGAISLLGTIITVTMANRQTLAALSEQSQLADADLKGKIRVIETKIEELSKKVDKHNSVIERTYDLESRVSVLESRGGS